jgi:hypothetical protein
LEPFLAWIAETLEADKKKHRKQRHTAKRIFERLRDEHGFTGKYTVVKDVVREHSNRFTNIHPIPILVPYDAQVLSRSSSSCVIPSPIARPMWPPGNRAA